MLWQAAGIFCRYFFAGNCGKGGKHKTKQGFTSCGHSGQAICREQSLSQNTGPQAKLSGSFLSVLLHISWRVLKESFKLNWAFASKSATEVAWFSEALKASVQKKKGCEFFLQGKKCLPLESSFLMRCSSFLAFAFHSCRLRRAIAKLKGSERVNSVNVCKDLWDLRWKALYKCKVLFYEDQLVALHHFKWHQLYTVYIDIYTLFSLSAAAFDSNLFAVC